MSRATEACARGLQQGFGPQVLCDAVSVDGDPQTLLSAEQPAVALASAARRREFAAGRSCARALLQRLGLPIAPVPAAADRSPIWPAGAIGSIAHSDTLCVVAVARQGELLSLGLDVEPDQPLEADLWSTICTPAELERLLTVPGSERGRAARLLFSAKESVYKCLYPVLRLPLEFHEVEIEVVSGSGFRARLAGAAAAWSPAPLPGFHARCEGSLLTGLCLPASPAGPPIGAPIGAPIGPPAEPPSR
jgi:4'-phosphopantetheinyl transferase EntD